MATLQRSLTASLWSALVLAILLTPVPALAQDGTQVPVPHNQTVSTNPFGLMYEFVNAEYERKLTPSTTWGLSASHLGVDDFDYTNGNLMFRFYPQGAALSGFFIGSRTGIYRVSGNDDAGVFFGAGFEVGYNWLLGAKRNFDISIGLGATRLFGGDLEGASLTIPSLRLLNVGISF